jgi:tetratricopeptide (TPR) repeat protein
MRRTGLEKTLSPSHSRLPELPKSGNRVFEKTAHCLSILAIARSAISAISGRESGEPTFYNLFILRNSSAFVLISLFLAAFAVPELLSAQAAGPRSSQILLIMPFENASSAPGIDWIGEAFPEVLGQRLNTGSLSLVSRADRQTALDRLGLPAFAKPSRAMVYQVAQALDADYILMGEYRLENNNLTAQARLMDMSRLRLSPEMVESGPLTELIALQTALAWDVLSALRGQDIPSKEQFVAKFPPIRPDALENYIRGVLAPTGQEKIRHFKEAVRLDPGDSLAMLQLGKAYFDAKDYEPAILWLAKIPRNSPSANEADFYLGLAAFYGGQMDKSQAAFRSLASRLPLTEVYNNLGVASVRLGDGRAREYFEKTVQTDPNDPDYHFNLALELYREGRVQEAARELKSVLAINPDAEARALLEAISSGARPARIPLERIKRNYDEASFRALAQEIEISNEARLQKTDPATHAAFHVARGHQLLEQGLVSEADKEFREAVILDPTSAAAHAGLARVLESSADIAGARNEARASLRLTPSAEGYLVLARLDLAENNSVAAQQNVEHALALEPANAAAAALKHDIAAGLAGKSRPQP